MKKMIALFCSLSLLTSCSINKGFLPTSSISTWIWNSSKMEDAQLFEQFSAMNHFRDSRWIHYLEEVVDELVFMNYTKDKQTFIELGTTILTENKPPSNYRH